MRAERSIRRADLCVLIVDLTMGVTRAGQTDRGPDSKSAQSGDRCFE